MWGLSERDESKLSNLRARVVIFQNGCTCVGSRGTSRGLLGPSFGHFKLEMLSKHPNGDTE